MKKLICCKCKLEINRKEDRWVNIRDFNKDNQETEIDLHLQCWKERSRTAVNKAVEEKARQLSPMLGNIMGKFGGMTQNA